MIGAQLRVVSAAVCTTDGTIVPGVRHFSPDMRALLHHIYGPNSHYYSTAEQGFLLNDGSFVTREKAWEVAEAAGQIIRRVGGDDGCLYSENLY